MLPRLMQAWKRTYWTVWVANLVTSVGLMSFVPFFPAHLARMGMSERGEIEVWSGLLYGAAPLTAALAGPLWGALGDRLGRRLMTVRALLAITLFVGLMSLARSPGELLALRFAQGLFSGFVAPSLTLVSVLVPRERQGQVTGSLQTALAAGMILGPILGGELGPDLGLDRLFLVVAGMALTSALLVAFFAQEDATQRRHAGGELSPLSVLQGTARDVSEVLANKLLRGPLAVSFAVHFGQGATRALLLLYVTDLLPDGSAGAERWTGRLAASFALATLIAMPLWGRLGDRVGFRRALVACALLTSVTFGLQAGAPGLVALFAFHVAHGALAGGSSPLVFGLAATEVSVDRRGGALGVVVSSRTLAVALGAALAGVAAQLVGIRGLFALSGVVVALSAATLRARPPAANPD